MSNCTIISTIRAVVRLSLLFAVVYAPQTLAAQGTSATVSGAVTDPTGAKVPAASVKFTNTATGASTTATTNGEGLYRISGLLPGLYNSTVTTQGFKSVVRQGIDLHVEDQVVLDYALEIGVSTESVTISANTAVLETQSPTVSQVIEGRQVEDTPLNGRNTMNLIALTPGVVAQGATSGAASNNTTNGSFTNAFGFGNYQIAGGLANQGSLYIDGAPVNYVEGHGVSFVITQDAVQEFRVESSVVNPQYGEFGGGVISFATKSGGSSFHGSLYEYLRNTIFNANNFFLKNVSQPRPQYIQNQFGATIGGPILKEKAFFFISYEGFRQAQGIPNTGRVPTPAELSGNFVGDAPIFDPTTDVKNAAGVVVSETQFSCNGIANVICPNRIDATSNVIGNVVKYFPTPNTTNVGPAVNYSLNGQAAARNNEYIARGDYALSSRQKLFIRYARLDRFQQGTKFLNNTTGGPTSGASVGATVQDYVLGDTIILNPTSVIDIRVSALRYYSGIFSQTTNLAQFGPFWAAIAPQLNSQVFPSISITNDIPQPLASANYIQNPVNEYAVSGTYSKLLGRHSLSFGGEARQSEEYFLLNPDAAGLFVFAGTSTACIPTGGPTTCKTPAGIPEAPTLPGAGATPEADFVTGAITAAPLGFPVYGQPSTVNRYGGLFANDTFQMTQRFTVTAGVRYELPGGFIEKHDNNAILLPQLANPLVLVNSAAYSSRSDLQKHLTLFSPRVGFAYTPFAGTSFRAGYSLAYLPADTVYNAGPQGSTVEAPSTFVVPGMKLSNPLLANALGPTTLLKPLGRAYGSSPTYYYGQTISGREPFSRFPYMQQWNASVQQSLGSSAIFQLAYLGSRGEHLPIYGSTDINQISDANIAAGTESQSNRPYPEYQNVNANSPYIGDTYYNSLQATLNKHFKSGGTILANYTWSKFLGNSESTNAQVEIHTQGLIQDYDNLRAEKSYLSFDVPQHLVVSYIVDLPVGKGKHFLSNTSDSLDKVVGGWNASGINSFESGFPLAIIATANALNTLYGAGTIRPNVVLGCSKALSGSIVTKSQTQSATLNAACFTAPVGLSFGNEPRTDGQIRDQGVDNWDFSIGKTTSIHDNVSLVFRAEAFNVFNRVQFGDPNVTSSSSAFGVITTQANQPRSFQFSLRANY